MLIRHIMSEEVVTLNPDTTCREAYRRFKQAGIRRAPVMVGDRLVGIVSERDLLRVLPGTVGQVSTLAGEEGLQIPVETVMAREVLTVHPSDHLEVAVRLMLKHKVGGIPVVDGGRLKGIITESDIFRAVWGMLSSAHGCRILFETPQEPAEGEVDYVGLAIAHGCKVRALLRYPREPGAMYFIRVEGDGADAFVKALWQNAAKVISLERGKHGAGI
jgi:acetoin utilization protein AcuB